MEQDVLLLQETEKTTDSEASPVVLVEEPPVAAGGLPRLFWVAAGTVALNLVFAVGMFATATPGRPLPAVASADAAATEDLDFSEGAKLSPVGDGTDAGPRSRLTPLPVPKLRPSVETTISAITQPDLGAPAGAVIDLPRSSVFSMPRQSMPAASTRPAPATIDLPRSSTAEMKKAVEPALPRSSQAANAAQAAAEAASQAAATSVKSSRPAVAKPAAQ